MNFTTPIVIGLECHVELDTVTKLFCPCKKSNASPNSSTCPTCLGHPGSKPVFNKKVLEYALKLCLALKCEIAPELIFSRKSYFYPDMAKNYQITQYEMPLATGGHLNLESGKEINLERIHIEEDPAALIHKIGYCLVDYNRSGNPLLEIVTKPEFSSPEEARDFLNQLIITLKYLGIFNPEKNIIKADANISIKESNYTRVEIKNISGFKQIEKALFYEVDRQKENPTSIVQETRGWDPQKAITISQRLKETEADYGYVIDTDLVPIEITDKILKTIQDELPELAGLKHEKFKTLGVRGENAKIISKDKHLAALLEILARELDPEFAAKWIRREILKIVKYHKKKVQDLNPEGITKILKAAEQKKITDKITQQLLEKYIVEPFDVEKEIAASGVLEDTTKITQFCNEANKENPKAVEDYKKGEEKSFNFLVGKVMQKTKGKANPPTIKEILFESI